MSMQTGCLRPAQAHVNSVALAEGRYAPLLTMTALTTEQTEWWSPRARWDELPESVRAGIEGVLGAAVVSAHNQSSGFSPGLAARVRCADGTRAFVKAVGSALNADSPDLYRREGATAGALPARAPVPALRGVYDDGDWVALVFDEIDGRPPTTPWKLGELNRVVDAVVELTTSLTPCPLSQAPLIAETLRSDFASYSRLAESPPDDLGDWERRHLDALAELSHDTLRHLGGDTLVHLDLRADNILLADDGRVYFVDWPWASRCAAWVDLALFLINVALSGHDPEIYVTASPLFDDVAPWHVTGLRDFQRAQLDVTVPWLQRRTGWT